LKKFEKFVERHPSLRLINRTNLAVGPPRDLAFVGALRVATSSLKTITGYSRKLIAAWFRTALAASSRRRSTFHHFDA
jgi:hypothetical protein